MAGEKHSRLAELERRFSELESQLRDSPEKQALSLLHAIIHEDRRRQWLGETAAPPAVRPAPGSEVADLYKDAPPMTGTAQSSGIPAGTPAPDFTLPDPDGRPVSLSDFAGQTVLLVFYPLDWSPACSDQLSLYQSELDEFEKLGVQLVAISVDSLYSHGAWAVVRGLTYPLLADFQPRGAVANRYGVYREADGFSERALFLIDPQGVIRFSHVSPELQQVPDIYELFSQLKVARTSGVDGQPKQAIL